MSDYKPKNWTGTCEDQLELFIEILAYLIEREVLDRNNKCMSVESFCHYVPLLIQNEGHYEVAIQRFEEMLADWNVEYLPETGIKDQLIITIRNLQEPIQVDTLTQGQCVKLTPVSIYSTFSFAILIAQSVANLARRDKVINCGDNNTAYVQQSHEPFR